MENSKLAWRGFTHAIGVTIYIYIVAQFMFSMQDVMNSLNAVLTGMAVLLLFTVSAAITVSLVLLKPVLLFMDGQKKESLKLLLYTVAGLFLIMVIVFLTLAIMA